MKPLPAAALLLCLAGPAAAQGSGAEPREFASGDGRYRVAVTYSGAGGAGDARLDVSGPGGKKISSFVSGSAPFTVTVSPDGSRLFLFCGSWGQMVQLYTLQVFSAEGRRLASHRLPMSGPAGESFSGDGSVYAVGADQADRRVVLALDARSGKELWRREFKERISGLKLSGDGRRLLAVLQAGDAARKVAVLGPGGKEVWSGTVKTSSSLTPRDFPGRGEAFELWEERAVYDEADGYWHNRVVKKRRFLLEDGAYREISGDR